MPRFLKHKKEDTGQAPDALYFRGKKRQEKPILTLMRYDSAKLDESRVSAKELSEVSTMEDAVHWYNLYGVHDDSMLSAIGDTLGVNQLALSGVMDTYARPQIKWFGEDLYISLKMLSLEGRDERQVHSENLVLYLRNNLLVTFQEREGDVFDPVRKRIRSGRRRIRKSGGDYLFFALLDVVVDNYGFVLSAIGEELEALEERVFSSTAPEIRQEIFRYKKELSFLRKQIRPIRDLLQLLTKVEAEDLSPDAAMYAREVQNTLEHVYEVLDSYRDLLNDYFTTYHTVLTDRLNDTMRVLTVFSVIFIPLTFIAGVYGTNFRHIPELSWANGYYIMLGVMAFVALVMVFYFRRRRWL